VHDSRAKESPSSSPLLPVEAIIKDCARVASCAHSHDLPAFRHPGACVDEWIERGPSDPLVGCLARAASCDAVDACLHEPSSLASVAYCRAHPGAPTGCDGSRLVVCGDDPEESRVVDCASLGARCSLLTQAGGLSTHACVDPVRCPPELTRVWCQDGSFVVSCHDGEIERAECPAGSSCQEHIEGDGDHAAMCEVAGHTACPKPGTRRCEASRLVVCESHGHFGHEHITDCMAEGLSCTEREGRAACTDGPSDCNGAAATCEGSALSFCALGRSTRVACSELGLGPCEADGRGTEAACGRH
jgi:hypothetical protein